MAKSAGELLPGLLSLRDSPLSPQLAGPLPKLLRDLIDGRIALERLSDNTVVLVGEDGTRETLSPEQTAALAMVLLKAAAGHQREEGMLLKLHAIAAAENFAAPPEKATGAIPSSEPHDPEDDDAAAEGMAQTILPPSLRDMAQEGPRVRSGSENPDNAQFRTGYSPGFVGPARGHLDALPDEDLRFRESFRRGLTVLDIGDQGSPLAGDIGERQAAEGADQHNYINAVMAPQYESGFVGPGINHLTALRNEDYRFAEIAPRQLGDRRSEVLFRNDLSNAVPVPIQLVEIKALEDEPIRSSVFPDGIPADGKVTNLAITRQPSVGSIAIDAEGGFAVELPPHFSGTLIFSYGYTDGAGVERTGTVVIPVSPVVDPAAVSVGAGAFAADEDQSLRPVGLAAELVDNDGSESMSRIAVEGVPSGMRFVDERGAPLGADLGGGVWLFQHGEIERLSILPGAHVSGVFNLSLHITTTEQSTGDSTTVTTPFSVTFGPVADRPSVSAGAGDFPGTEDQPVDLTGLAVDLIDRDGSESLTGVSIRGVPAGAVFIDANGARAGSPAADGSWSFTAAALDGLRFVGPAHASGAFDMVLTALSRESANGDSAQTTVPFRVTLQPAPDAPDAKVGTGAFAGSEDTPIAMAGLSTALVDQDGSEQLDAVRLLGVPPGGRFSDAAGKSVGQDIGDGAWVFTPAELAGLHFLPPHDVDGTFALTLESAARENATGEAAVTRLPIVMTITAVADAPSVPDSVSTGREDGTIAFGGVVAYGLTDTDGSERVSAVTLSGFPAGASVTYAAAGAASVTLADGVYTIAGPAADIRATLDSFALRPPADSDANLALAVTVTTTDTGGSTATATGRHSVIVAAVADAPAASGAATGAEDTDIPLVLTLADTDVDGSQSITRVELTLPSGAGALGWTATAGAAVDAAGDRYVVSGTTEAAIRALLATLTVRPAANADAAFDVSVAVTSAETNPSTPGEVAVSEAVTRFALPVRITAVADAPSVPDTTSTGREDGTIAFGGAVAYGLTDTDGSERVSAVTLSGFPAGASVTYAAAGAASVTLADGVYTIAGPAADIRATLDSFALRPPADSDANLALAVTVTTTDTGGSTATATGRHTVIVAAVADAPLVSGSASGAEDTDIPLVLALADTDTDGSQSITSVRIADVPPGALLRWTPIDGATVSLRNGVYDIAGSEAGIRAVISTLALVPPSNLSGVVTLSVTVTSAETSPSETGEIAVLAASTTFSLPVTVSAIADAPEITVADSVGVEDSRIPLGGLSVRLGDGDGSETLSILRITDVPTGASFTDASGAARGTDNGDGSWSFASSDLAGLHFTPPVNAHGVFSFTLEAMAVEGANGAQATASRGFGVTALAAADAPVVSPSAAAIIEDALSPVGSAIGYALVDQDGSERITQIELSGLPTGSSAELVAVGGASVTTLPNGFRIEGPSADIRATLDGFAVRPPAHRDDDFTLTIAVTATDADGSTASTTAILRLNVAAVADAPIISGSATGAEDSVIPVPVTVSLADLDGSESLLAVIVSNIPAGAVLGWNASLPGAVSAQADGGYRFTGTTEEIEALLLSLTVLPAAHSDMSISLRVTAISQESSTCGGQIETASATQSFDIPVTVTAIADAPVVPAGSTTGNEDTAILFGPGVTWSLADTDGSERVSAVALSGVPAGAALTWTVSGAATVTLAAGVYTVAGPAADIRATLDSFALTPGTNRDQNVTLAVAVTVTDTGGVTATTAGTHLVRVAAVADAPAVSGSASGAEDTDIPLSLAIAEADADGSQSLTRVELTVPAGAGTLAWTPVAGAAAATVGAVTTVTGTDAAIRALLATLTVRPAANSDAAFAIAVTVTSSETAPAETGAGEIATLSATTTYSLPVTVTAIADAPVVPAGSTTGNEDTAILFGPGVTWSLADADGSERVSAVALSGVPAGAALTWTVSGAATVTLAAGVYTVAGPAADIRATLDSFALTPGSNRDQNVTLAVAVTVTDTGGVTATTAGTHLVRVAAVADAPAVSGAASGAEDTDIPLSLTIAEADADGSQSLTRVELTVPAGAGTLAWTPVAGAAAATVGAVTTVTGTDAAIRALLATLTVRPAANSDAAFAIAVTVTSSETAPAETGAGEIATLSATTTYSLPVTVTAIADAPVVPAGSTTGAEDTAILFGPGVTWSLADADGSERVSAVALSGVPAGAALTWTVAGAATVTLAAGVHTIAGSAADIRATLDSFALTPGTNRDQNVTLAVAVTVTDTGGVTATTAGTHLVRVAAVADAPAVSGSASGAEDTDIPLSLAIAEADADGSQSLTRVELTVPAGAGTLAWTPVAGAAAATVGAVTTVTGTDAAIRALLATLTVRPAANSDAAFAIAVTVTSSETAPAETGAGEIATLSATTTYSLPVTVTAIADAPVVPAGSTTGNEDTAILFGPGVTWSLADADGSERVSAVALSGVPAGAALTWTVAGAATVTLAAGVYTVAGPAADICATLDSFALTPGTNRDQNVTLAVAVTVTDTGGVTATTAGTHLVRVAAVADAPAVSGAASGAEDTDIPLSLTIAEADADGSQSLTRVELTVPAGAGTLAWTPVAGAAAATVGAVTTVTGTDAAIRALLATLTVRPAANSDAAFAIAVTVTSSETAPAETGAGEIATLEAATTTSLPVTVTAIADAPVVPAGSTTGNEDTAILFGPGVTWSLADADGSERVSAVALSGVPAGAALTWAVSGAATVTLAAGVHTIAGSAADIRATLDSFALTPGTNRDQNVTLAVAVTVTDTGGVTATTAGTHLVRVAAVADAPAVSGSASGAEDTDIPLSLTIAEADADGSQSLTRVELTVPAGAGTLAWTPVAGAAAATVGAVTTVTGTDAAIRALLATLTVRPAANSDAAFAIAVTVTSSETAPAETGAGEIATLSATTTYSLPVTVTAIADAPVVPAGSTTGNEDTAILFGPGVTWSLADADGSERVSAVALSGVPAGAALTWTVAGAATVTLAAGVHTIAGSAADIRATLDSFALTPGTNRDQNVTLAVAVTVTDTGGVTATTAGTHLVRVAAVADAPLVSGAASGAEDTDIPLSLTIAEADADGSQSLTRVELTVPAGAGTLAWTPVAGAAAATVGAVTTVTGTDAAIRALLATLTVRPAANSDAAFAIAVTVTSSETAPAETGAGEIATLSATTTYSLPVTVTAIADAPVVPAGSTTGAEDTAILFGPGVTWSLADADGSERVSAVALSGVPAGAALTWTVAGAATVTLAAGVHTIAGSAADIRATLDSFALTPGTNRDQNVTLAVAVTVTDTGGVTATTAGTHLVRVAAVADAPAVSGSASGAEDTDIPLSLTIAEADADGSQSLTRVELTVPAGAGTLAWTPVAGAAAATVGAVTTVTGTDAAIRALLATLTVRPAANSDAAFAIAVTVTSSETAPAETGAGEIATLSATTTYSLPVTVTAIADAPVVPAGSTTGNEDTAILFGPGVTWSLADADGSERVSAVALSGVPAGAALTWTVAGAATVTLAAGVHTIAGSAADIRATLDSFALTPGTNRDQNVTLAVAVTVTDTGGVTATTAGTHLVRVAAVADAPLVSGAASGAEDTDIPLSLTIAEADADGSQSLTRVELTVPAGAGTLAWTPVAGAAAATVGAVTTVTGTDAAIRALLATLTVRPAANSDAAFAIAVTVTSSETAPAETGAGEIATLEAATTTSLPVTVTAIADAPVVPAGSTTGNEDTAILFGPGVTWSLADADGSERVSAVALSGVPAGAALTWAVSGAATVTLAAGVHTIAGSAADIRATLDSFALTPGTNRDQNVTLAVAVTVTDTGGVTATTAGTHLVRVAAVADAPAVSGSASGAEDTDIPLSLTIAEADADGSQSLTRVELTVPAGAGTLAWTPVAGAAAATVGAVTTVTGTDAAIRALLATLTVRPAANSDAAFAIAVTVTSSETAPAETGAGETATLDAATTTSLPVTVTAVADQATASNTLTNGTEDTVIVFGPNVTYSLTDADGSESVTRVVVSGAPSGWVLTYTAAGGGTVDTVTTPGSWIISGTPAGIRATLDTFRITPPLDSDDDAALGVAITTTDSNGSTATRSITHSVVVAADADTPAIAVGTGAFAGMEDTPIALPGFTVAITDTDASAGRPVSEVMHVIRITGVPAGASFQNSGGTPVGVNAGGNVWTFAASELADLRFVPTPQAGGVVTMNLEAVTRETSNGDLSTVASLPFTVTLQPVPDTPVVVVGTSSGNEDTFITFGTGITYAQPDLDGSERIDQVRLYDIDTTWTVSYAISGGATVDTSTPGVYVITGPTEQSIRDTLSSFAIRAPLDSDADTTVMLTVTSKDSNGNTATSAPSTHNVVVAADADVPSVSVGAATFNTNEDTRIALAGFAVAIADTDASAGRPVSESISLVRITGVSTQTGTGFENVGGTAVGTNLGSGIWTFTKVQIDAGIFYRPGTNRSGAYAMVLEATAQESSNLDTAVFSRNFTVNVAGVPDQVVVPTATTTFNEDTLASNIGTNWVTLSDNDGSQTLVITLSGLPTASGSTVTYTPQAGVTHSLAGGVLTLSGASNLVLTTLASIDVRAPAQSDANIPVTIQATTSENGSTLSAVTGTRTLQVRAVADLPTITGAATTSEDVAVVVPVTVALPDADGSESLTFVDVRLGTAGNVPPAGTILSVVANSGATAVFNGGTSTWRVTGTTAAIQSTLATGVTVTPAQHRGENITIEVQARSTEAATGAEVLTGSETATTAWTNVVVTVNDVADRPDVTVPSNQAIEEDVPLALTGLGIVKVDTDGSEVFTLTLAGVPDGASFGGRGTPGANVGGFRTWTFTEAEVSGLTFTPPLHVHGVWTLTATTTARESENSNSATSNARNFTITVDAQADAPTVAATGATGNEDSVIAFGATLASPTLGVQLVDQDGSERITSIAVSGFPAGVTPTYSLVNTGAVAVAAGVYTITGANESDIRATLATFALTPPQHSDANIALSVRATTLDADGSTATSTPLTHMVIVRAIADQPVLSVGATASGPEDSNIALSINADRVDTDGSEVLSVRITLPGGAATGTILGNTSGGGSIVNQGGGVWLVTAPTEAQLDTVLATLQFRPPTNWSGTASLQVEAIATETGPEIQTATALQSFSIAVTVGAVADPPALKVVPSIGGASGLEDQPIRLSIAVTLPDGDGSESYVVRLSNQPAGSVYTNAAGTAIGTQVSPGVWEFTPAQVAILHVKAPLNSNDDFTLNVEAIVTDTGPTGTSVTSISGVLPVSVIGVADAPTVVTPASFSSPEDQPIPIGLNVSASLVDTDGSETLYYVLAGLPAGTVPSRGVYIGGEWQIAAADMPFVTIPAPANFSGNYVSTFAPGLTVRAVAQENDGNETVSNIAVNITITPVIDGFSWSPAVTLPEESSISLGAARFVGTLPDSDGSEQITSYTFNLNGIVSAAGIGGVVSSTANFIANHVSGPFTNNGDGTITVTAANMTLVSFSAAAFRDSNVNFAVPVTARIQESDGSFQTVSSSFAISLDGVADVPTVFAGSVSGTAGTLIAVNPTGAEFGGVSTDTDLALGRALSERIYYIVSGLQGTPGVKLAFTNVSGQIVGLDNGDGSWYLEPADLTNLRILSQAGSNGTVNLTLTTVAVENDTGSRAQSATSASFSVTVLPGSGGSGPAPLAPQVSVSLSAANEDGVIPINITAQPAPGDTTNPTVSVMFSGVPAGFTLSGATFNPATGRWLATAADVNSGLVTLRPPANWSGSLTGAATLQVEAVAVNAFLNSATTGLVAAPISVIPDADGPAFSASPAAGIEDQPIALNLSVTPADNDVSSPETVLNPIIITVPAGTTLSAGTPVGGNVWHLTTAQLAGLTLTPPVNYHGPLSVTVQATTRDVNGDTQAGSTTLGLNVTARADIPNATAANITGTEDTQIALPGLSAALVDTDGSEILSVKISGVPVGALFNAGGNNGDGTWTIPVASLASLAITPPPQFSGTISLNLIAYALETSNGNTAARTVPFNVTVLPVADSVILDPLAVSLAEDASALLSLRVKLEDKQGVQAGENPAELVEIVLSGLPAGAALTGAGTVESLGGGVWRFTGTEAQSNTLSFTPATGYAGSTTVNLSAVTIDGAARLATPATDSFVLSVAAVADSPVLQTNPVTGPVGQALPVNLFAFASDTDGSESVTVTVTGAPTDAIFSAGTSLGGGAWLFTPPQLSGLTLTLAAGTTNTSMNVVATATEASNGSTATSSSTIALTVGSAGMTLAGTSGADLLTGWTGNDTIVAGNGNDTLIGGAGSDSMTGGAGNDVYHVSEAGDAVVELAGGGTDRVNTTLATYTLGSEVEELAFVGAGAINAAGNTLANLMLGGTGNDTLNGGVGNDTLIGGQGADLLTGGSGSDTFRYGAGDNAGGADQINGFTAGAGGDVIDIDALLPGYDNNPANLANFVNLNVNGGNTELRIDPGGTGTFASTLLTLQGVTGLDLNSLRLNGNLVA